MAHVSRDAAAQIIDLLVRPDDKGHELNASNRQPAGQVRPRARVKSPHIAGAR
jgi:hypothetical protein